MNRLYFKYVMYKFNLYKYIDRIDFNVRKVFMLDSKVGTIFCLKAVSIFSKLSMSTSDTFAVCILCT